MQLSVLIASRNDTFEGTPGNMPLDRLAVTLRRVLARLPNDGEVVVVDWGSDVPIAAALPADLRVPPLRITRVPKPVCSSCGSAFSEAHALNHAARLAKGQWLARLDQDTFPSGAFWRWFNPEPGLTYFSNRREMAEGQTDPRGDEPLSCGTAGRPDYWRWHVGVLLVERSVWWSLRGYDERNVHRNHLEHEFISRLNRVAPLLNLGAMLGCPFYHQWHGRADGVARRQNAVATDEALATVPLVPNGETWGLRDQLPSNVLWTQ